MIYLDTVVCLFTQLHSKCESKMNITERYDTIQFHIEKRKSCRDIRDLLLQGVDFKQLGEIAYNITKN